MLCNFSFILSVQQLYLHKKVSYTFVMLGNKQSIATNSRLAYQCIIDSQGTRLTIFSCNVVAAHGSVVIKASTRILSLIRDQRTKKQGNREQLKSCETREVFYNCKYTNGYLIRPSYIRIKCPVVFLQVQQTSLVSAVSLFPSFFFYDELKIPSCLALDPPSPYVTNSPLPRSVLQ